VNDVPLPRKVFVGYVSVFDDPPHFHVKAKFVATRVHYNQDGRWSSPWRGAHACTKVCIPIEVSYKLTVQYTRQYNFTYIREKSTVLPAPIFTKFANAQQHCLQICYTDLYLDRTITVESTNTNLFTPLSKVLIPLYRFSVIMYTINITTTIYCFLI